MNIKIWGWAEKYEKVSIRFIDSTYNAIADNEGNWEVVFPKMNAGGPYEMQIIGRNSITISDILIGDVWVCSGQSNMALSMNRVRWVYPDEIANSYNTDIRQFIVPQKYNFNTPQKDLDSGSWKSANPENVLSFSAVAYFFAKAIYEKYKIPIGLINASLGGSPAEAWISEESLKEFPVHYSEAQKFKDSSIIKNIIKGDNKNINEWYTLLRKKDAGYKDLQNLWYSPELITAGWLTFNIPGFWADTELGQINGSVWFRKKINITQSIVGKPAKLILGRIVDADLVYINGVFIGATNSRYMHRRYDIPSDLLKEGENTIVIRVINKRGKGGFVLDESYQLETKSDTIDLTGNWKCRSGAAMDPLAVQTYINRKPLGLFNAMIAPLFNYRIKGILWYQGESNTKKAIKYRTLFSTLIRDWRKHWKQSDLPFLFVQLPNYMDSGIPSSESNHVNGESGWALVREAQLKTLSLPNTGMAVTIDIGEWNDSHPLNKKDVGSRLALAAEKIAYGEDSVVYSGPIFNSMKSDGNKIILTFTNIGSGLVARGSNELKGFTIAGSNKGFIWANAKIENDKVVVWNDSVSEPIAVRYAWSDNPEGANLYNKEGLPASPFRTDE